MKATIFERLESEVRCYVRSFPTVFCQAAGCWLTDESGKRYLDFFAGAGSLNYGHNHPALKSRLMTYLDADGIVQGLDMATGAKRAFMEAFERLILVPRHMSYKLQFTGPTGANAVEAALKIARLNKQRNTVLCFTNAFHGVSAGAAAATGQRRFRQAVGLPLEHTRFMPYAGYYGSDVSTLAMIERQLQDPGSGLDHPAAILVETVQGEGGLNTASRQWLRGLADLCRRHDMLFIIDDIQMGCGRTGTFFSFEEFGISPDIIILSKSLSGYGLPMSLVLLKPQLDIWEPAAHNGTFRGNNAAFVTATAALHEFWRDEQFSDAVQEKGRLLHNRLRRLQRRQALVHAVRGRGMVAGLLLDSGEMASRVATLCFQRGLMVETCGPNGEVLKLMPPLTVDDKELETGLDIVEASLNEMQLELEAATRKEMSA
jgi:diaminobutyrate-2-oxoglutarate transaminase